MREGRVDAVARVQRDEHFERARVVLVGLGDRQRAVELAARVRLQLRVHQREPARRHALLVTLMNTVKTSGQSVV